MQYTRQRIIEYLHTNRTITAPEMSRILQTTSANIRHHIKELISQEVVEELGHLPNRGRGRPTKIYGLTPGTSKNNLVDLASVLLDLYLGKLPKRAKGGQLTTLAKSIISEPILIHPNLVQRFIQAVQLLNQLNYRASWEVHVTGPRIILHHCPYTPIISDHPELCQMDEEILKLILDKPIKQISRSDCKSAGSMYCTFDIG